MPYSYHTNHMYFNKALIRRRKLVTIYNILVYHLMRYFSFLKYT